MISTNDRGLIGSGWRDVLAWLPRNLDEMAKEEFGFRRRGKIQSAADIVRIAALLHGSTAGRIWTLRTRFMGPPPLSAASRAWSSG